MSLIRFAAVLAVFVAALAFGGVARASEVVAASAVQAAEREALAHGPSDARARLASFRARVEATAYRQTLALCAGYLAAVKPEMAAHIRARVSEAEIAGAWLQVILWGLAAQPDHWLGGLKSEYLEINNLNLLDRDYWAGSMYRLYLFDSDGFAKAAAHCLNTFDNRDVVRFALAIAAVDDFADGFGATVALSATLSSIGPLVARAASWVLWPARALASRLTRGWSAGAWRALGGSVGYVLFDDVSARFALQDNATRGLNFLARSDELSEESGLELGAPMTPAERGEAAVRRLATLLALSRSDGDVAQASAAPNRRFVTEACAAGRSDIAAYRAFLQAKATSPVGVNAAEVRMGRQTELIYSLAGRLQGSGDCPR